MFIERARAAADVRCMTRSHLRAAAVGALTAGALLSPGTPAGAQLGLPLPDLGQIVTQVGGTVGGVLPVGGGVVTETTGTVGGIVTGTTGTVTDTVNQALGGALGGGGLLPTDTLDSLLGSLGLVYLNGPAGPAGAGGAGGAGTGAGTTGPGGLVLDARSPNARFQILSRLSRIAKTGRIPVRVAVDEAGIVAFKGSVRPGKARKLAKRTGAKKAVSRKPIKFPSAVLAFRKAGSLRVTIQLSRQAQRRLGRVRDARMSLAVLTADVLRNQGKTTFKRVVKR
jgi:hypothetical protein